jgi:plasmid stabilization system protein ParE
LLRLIGWLSERSPAAARRAAAIVIASIDELSEFPELGPRSAGERRERTIRFGRDGFIVQYSIHGDEIVV